MLSYGHPDRSWRWIKKSNQNAPDNAGITICRCLCSHTNRALSDVAKSGGSRRCRKDPTRQDTTDKTDGFLIENNPANRINPNQTTDVCAVSLHFDTSNRNVRSGV